MLPFSEKKLSGNGCFLSTNWRRRRQIFFKLTKLDGGAWERVRVGEVGGGQEASGGLQHMYGCGFFLELIGPIYII